MQESEPSFETETEDFSTLPTELLPPDPEPVTVTPVRRSWTRERERPIELKVGMRVSYQGVVYELGTDEEDIMLDMDTQSMLTITMMEVNSE